MFHAIAQFITRSRCPSSNPAREHSIGDIAVAHGTVKEKRVRNGKDVSGEGVYMDFLEKRSGKWVVVRSAGKLLPNENSAR